MKTFARVLTLALVLVGGSLTLGGDAVQASSKKAQPENCCTYPVCPPNCF